MMIIAIRAAAIATIAVAGMTAGAAAQTSASDPHHRDTSLAQATPPAEPGAMGQGQGAQPGMPQPGMMGENMMGGMMQGGMMGQGMMGPGMGMGGHSMKMMFIIADTDGDGALSFEEATAVHKRIFDAADADKDGKATREELQNFMRD